jgi:Tfp pilus assembly protein PilZ
MRRVGVAIQEGTSGLGPNIAVGLANVSDDGLGVRINAPIPVGLEVSVELFLPGVHKPIKLVGEVRWCSPVGDSTHQAGLRLRRRLTYSELTGMGGRD